MIIEPIFLAGAYRIRLDPHRDERGHFVRTFCTETFGRHGLETSFSQRSLSFNKRTGTLRGLHFQEGSAMETKIVRCARGAVFDVMVDLRQDSSTYGRWYGEELTPGNLVMLYIPRGFAHGFQTLVDGTEIAYEITPAYDPTLARGVRFDDSTLAIPWPLTNPIISERDASLPALADVAAL